MQNYQNSLSPEKVRTILKNKNKFSSSPSDYLNSGWEMINKETGNYVGFFLLYFVISIIISFLFSFVGTYIPYLAELTEWISSILGAIIMPGTFVFAYNQKYNSEQDFNNFLSGFNHFGPLAGQYLLMWLLVILSILPLGLIFGFSFNLNMFSESNISNLLVGSYGFIFVFIFIIYLFIWTIWVFAPMFIMFAGMGIWESMESSRKMVLNNFGVIIVTLLIQVLLAIAGVFSCGIGFLWLIPLFYVTYFLLFDDLFQLNQKLDETDEIIQHLL